MDEATGDDGFAGDQDRRDALKKIGIGAAGAAAAWSAPSVLSVTAAAAATDNGPNPPQPRVLLGVNGGGGGGLGGEGTLGSYDTSTAAATLVGNLSVGSGQGLASDGVQLFHFVAPAANNPSSLSSVAYPGLQQTNIPLQAPGLPNIVNGATYNGGFLYVSVWSGISQGPSDLYTVNPTNGAVTLVGQISNGVQTWGLAFLGGILYGISATFLGTAQVYPINPVTAAAGPSVQVTGIPNGEGGYGMAVDGSTGTMYVAIGAWQSPATLYRLNPVTGAATAVGAMNNRVADIAVR